MIKDPNCKNRNYTAAELDLMIIMEINKLALDPTYIDALKEDRPVNDADQKISAIKTEIESINSQISKMMDLYALGHFDLNTINTKVADLNDTKNRLEKEMDSLQGTMNEDDRLSPKQVKSIAELFTDEIDLAQKRSIVQSLIHYIEIDNEDVLIHWKF